MITGNQMNQWSCELKASRDLRDVIYELLTPPKKVLKMTQWAPRREIHKFFANFKLGGHLGPEEKYLAPPPPPQFPKFSADTLPAPSHPRGRPPPLLGFSMKKTDPPLPVAPDSPFPSPEQKKNKKYPKRPPSKAKKGAKLCLN